MDAPAIREELRDMGAASARRDITCMLPNLYYRAGVIGAWTFARRSGSAGTQRMYELMKRDQHPDGDGRYQGPARLCRGPAGRDTRLVGTVGYCMSGRYAINAADAFPDRVKAAASIYGTHLATDQPDSPHAAAARPRAELYFGCPRPMSMRRRRSSDKVKGGMEGTGNEVEIYSGTHHGFAFPKRPSTTAMPRTALGAAARALSPQLV